MGELLKDKVVVVTGSGQGIGRAIAVGMAQEGAKVVTNNRKRGSTGNALLGDSLLDSLDSEKREWFSKEVTEINGDAETTARAIRESGGEAIPFFGDISDFKVAAELIQTTIDRFGRIDILINAAGTFGFSSIWEITEETWDRVTGTKPKGYFNTIRHAAPHMMKQGWGRILNCTSRAFNGDVIKHAEYCTANAGVNGLTKAAAKELLPYGITCNAFAPWAKTRASYELETYDMAVSAEESPWLDRKLAKKIDTTPTAGLRRSLPRLSLHRRSGEGQWLGLLRWWKRHQPLLGDGPGEKPYQVRRTVDRRRTDAAGTEGLVYGLQEPGRACLKDSSGYRGPPAIPITLSVRPLWNGCELADLASARHRKENCGQTYNNMIIE